MNAPTSLNVPPRTGTWSEEHRHACEVRLVASWTPERRAAYCKLVSDKRGRPAAVKLWRDAKGAA